MKLKRINSQMFYLGVISLVVILLITYFFESGLAEFLFYFDYNAKDLVGTKAEIQSILIPQVLTWEIYIDSAMRYVMNIFPLFAVIPVIPFLQERKSYFVFGANRFKNYQRSLAGSALQYVFLGGVAVTLGFVIFFTIGNLVMVPSISNIGGFADIFPKNFYINHAYLFFIFLAMSMYFLVGCTFAAMAVAIGLWQDKSYYMLVVPLLVYIIESYIGFGFNLPLFKISSCVGAFNTTTSTFACFLPLLPLMVVDAVLIYLGIRKRGKQVGY